MKNFRCSCRLQESSEQQIGGNVPKSQGANMVTDISIGKSGSKRMNDTVQVILVKV